MLAIVLLDHYLRHRGAERRRALHHAGHHAAQPRQTACEVVSHGASRRKVMASACSAPRAWWARPSSACCEERDFPVSELFPLASNRSLGKRVEFRGRHIPVIDVATFDFSRAQIGLFSAGGEVSREYAPKAAAAGCIVIDNTSEFRYEDDIPLVVPEVNPKAIAQYKTRNIIANPNCSTIQMVVALKPIHDAVGIDAHQRGHLPVRVGRRQGSRRRVGGADRRADEWPGARRSRRSSPSASPSTPCRRSTSSWTTATPRKR